MAKHYINFDEKVYGIDEANLAPATDALKAHLETLKGGESGGLVEGGTYTLKNNLNDINPADFMKAPLVDGAYTIFRYDPSVSAGLGFVTAELLASFGANVVSDGWMVTTPDIENIYYYPLKMVDDASGEMVDNYVGWLTIPGNNVVPEISITIPSPFDADFAGYSLEELAIFFDIPTSGNDGDTKIVINGAEYWVDSTKLAPATNDFIAHLGTLKGGEGGGLVEGETYTLKNNLNDIDPSYWMKAPLDTMDGIYTVFRYDPSAATGLGYVTADVLVALGGSATSDGWMVTTPDLNSIYYYPLKVVDDASGEMIDNNIGWLTIPGYNVVSEISVTIPSPFNADYAGYSLEELAIFFDIPTSGNEGDTKITINGAEYWVDSAKLADAKRALAAHLKALEDASIPEESKYQLTIERNGIIYHWDVDSPSKLWLNLNGKYDTTNTYYINCPYASSYVCLASSAAIVGGVENSASIVQYGDNAYSVEEIYYTVAQQQGDSN